MIPTRPLLFLGKRGRGRKDEKRILSVGVESLKKCSSELIEILPIPPLHVRYPGMLPIDGTTHRHSNHWNWENSTSKPVRIMIQIGAILAHVEVCTGILNHSDCDQLLSGSSLEGCFLLHQLGGVDFCSYVATCFSELVLKPHGTDSELNCKQ